MEKFRSSQESIVESRRNVERGIDEVYRQYASEFPLSSFNRVGAAYDRYQRSTEDAVAHRLSEVLQHAGHLKIHVPRDMIFVDSTSHRKIAQRMMYAAISSRVASVLLAFCPTRLSRDEAMLMTTLSHLRRETGVRCIFVDSKIDTDKMDCFQMWAALEALNAMRSKPNGKPQDVRARRTGGAIQVTFLVTVGPFGPARSEKGFWRRSPEPFLHQ